MWILLMCAKQQTDNWPEGKRESMDEKSSLDQRIITIKKSDNPIVAFFMWIDF